jgi:hypothetical protein
MGLLVLPLVAFLFDNFEMELPLFIFITLGGCAIIGGFVGYGIGRLTGGTNGALYGAGTLAALYPFLTTGYMYFFPDQVEPSDDDDLSEEETEEWFDSSYIASHDEMAEREPTGLAFCFVGDYSLESVDFFHSLSNQLVGMDAFRTQRMRLSPHTEDDTTEDDFVSCLVIESHFANYPVSFLFIDEEPNDTQWGHILARADALIPIVKLISETGTPIMTQAQWEQKPNWFFANKWQSLWQRESRPFLSLYTVEASQVLTDAVVKRQINQWLPNSSNLPMYRSFLDQSSHVHHPMFLLFGEWLKERQAEESATPEVKQAQESFEEALF